MQACATGVRTLLAATQEIEAGMATAALAVNCDRTSNGPHIYYPNPRGAGGTGTAEDWVMENFNCDPLGGHTMLQTAENVAAKHGIGTAEQHELVLRREEQYRMSLENDSAFLRRFMTLPFDVPTPNYKKVANSMTGDEGVSQSTPEGLAKLKPVMPGGVVTFGAQTHPADGNAAIVVTTPRQGAGAVHQPEDRGAPARLRPGPRRAGLHARSHAAGGAARAAASRPQHRPDGRDQDPQPLRRQRHLFCQADRRRPRCHEQLRLFAGLGPSAGADGHALRSSN
jgi:acetyl-CoA acetyltransferase